ncbi:MAG: SDR family NAD(P)-dependent oxidoreductase, partial [Gammaproteobacteria bacterium]|nr:SDR family NAD(P)-dependent oxidoreductase [Gammaproteobacteria bacterium]
MLDAFNRHMHGYVALPILNTFHRRKIFEYIFAHPDQPIQQMVRSLKANEGHFRVALRFFQSLGWLTIDQKDRVFLYMNRIPTHLPSEALLATFYQDDIFETILTDKSHTALQQWFSYSKQNNTQYSQQLRDILDGPLMVVLLIALHKRNSNIKDLDKPTKKIVQDILVTKGWLQKGRLSALGKYSIDHSMVVAIAASYRSMLLQIETVIFGRPETVFTQDLNGHELHIDRLLNIEASSFQHEKYFSNVEEMMIKIFNHDSLETQPQYIVDMGCGDGSLLKRVYHAIQSKTYRGKHLGQYPLLLIGIDLNEKSLAATRYNLRDMPHLALTGNIAQPQQLIKTLKAHNVDFERCLHIRSFLDHELSYQDIEMNSVHSNAAVGVYVSSKGESIDPQKILQCYLEHFKAWASITAHHGLLILEVHSVSPRILPDFVDECESHYFDAIQSFSGQNLLSAADFLSIAAQAGLFAEKDCFQRFPRTFPYTRMTLNWFKKKDYQIRIATIDDLLQLLVLEKGCWALELQSDESCLRRWIEQQGAQIISYKGAVVGAVYTQRIAEESDLFSITYDNISDLHHPENPFLQLIKINVLPDVQHMGFGDALLSYVLQHALLKDDIHAALGVTRCTRYLSHAGGCSYEDYVMKADDPMLLFHISHGADIVGVVSDYRSDHENLDHGVLIKYAFQDDKDTETKSANSNGCMTSDEISALVTEQIVTQLHVYKKNTDYKPTTAFLDLGFDSLDLTELKVALNKSLSISLDMADFFRFGTPHSLIEYIQSLINEDLPTGQTNTSLAEHLRLKEPLSSDIAIIGMSCKLPGNIDSLDEYWKLLVSAKTGIVPIPEARAHIWNEYGSFDKSDPAFLYGGYIQNMDQFDASFFGISPREAVQIDPQHRILLELHWHALEHAGIDPLSLAKSKTGIYAGIFSHDFELLKQSQSNDVSDKVYLATGSSESIAAGRISYFLDLVGPSMAVNTACSSSLVAVHLACQGLIQKETNLALASGVNLMLIPQQTAIFSAANMLSTDGANRVFDENASGYVRSEGAGVVVLKRLNDAIRDKDKIYAVIRGTGINQDGASNGLTAPNQASQEMLMHDVLARANCDANSVTYVEAHGTGTILGDPVELSAIQTVYGKDRANNNPLYVGAVKSNLGHLEAASGITGLIKTVLMLDHKKLVQNLHFKTLNPHISLDDKKIKILTKSRKWTVKSGAKRIAGISSFGFSGTNAHMVLEEYSRASQLETSQSKAACHPTLFHSKSYPLHCLVSCAKNNNSLSTYLHIYQTYLEEHKLNLSIENFIYSTTLKSQGFDYRAIVIGQQYDELSKNISSGQYISGKVFAGDKLKISLCFSQSNKTKHGALIVLFCKNSPMFKAAVDLCRTYMKGMDEAKVESFILDYALGTLWLNLGIAPDILMGEGIGEYVAAVLSKVMTLEDGLQLAFYRPNKITVSTLASFKAVASSINYAKPTQPLISSFTGKVVKDAEINADYWLRQLQEKPNFIDGLSVLQSKAVTVYLEVGLGCSTYFDLMHELPKESQASNPVCISSLPVVTKPWHGFMEALGRLYVAGCSINWELVYPPSCHQKVVLPAYPFDRTRYWVDSKKPEISSPGINLSRGFLQSRLDTAGHEQIFNTELSLSKDAYLSDHIIFGNVVFPATGYLELCFEVMASLGIYQDLYCIDEAQFERILLLPTEGSVSLQLIVREDQSGKEIVIYSLKDAESWQVHCRARLVLSPEFPRKHLNIAKETSNTDSTLSGKDFYQAWGARQGISCGYEFQGIHNIYYLKKGILAEVSLGEEGSYISHPAVLDSCLQNIFIFALGSLTDQLQTYVPVLVKRICLLGSLPHNVWVKVEKPPTAIKNNRFSVDLELYNQAGEQIGFINEVIFAELTAKQVDTTKRAMHDVRERYYDCQWIPYCSLSTYEPPTKLDLSANTNWLLIHDNELFANALSMRLAASGIALCAVGMDGTFDSDLLSVTPLYERIIYASFASANADIAFTTLMDERSIHLLEVTQSVIRYYTQRNEDFPVFDILTSKNLNEASLVNSALWGIGRTIQNEYVDWKVRLIECNEADGVEMISFALWMSNIDGMNENQLRLEPKQIYVYRLYASALNQLQHDVSTYQMPINGVYLITGGLSGIGYAVCGMLVSQRVKQIALLSRRKPSNEQKRQFIDWEKQGVVVKSYAVDISDMDALKKAYLKIQQTQGAVKHIIHSAGVLADATLLNQTPEHYHRMYRSKVYGAWHLHQLTREDDLEGFIMFSSVSGLLGMAGQSNYAAANVFLDNLVQYRRSLGLAGLSIQWGAWAETGVAVEHLSRRRFAGFIPLKTVDGLNAFQFLYAQAGNISQISVMPMNWSDYQAQQVKLQPILSAFMTTTAVATSDLGHLLSELKTLSVDDANALLQQQLVNNLIDLLQYKEAQLLDPSKGFFELGMDSLMAVDYAQRIERMLNYSLKLKTHVLFDYPNVAQVTTYLISKIKALETDILPVKPMNMAPALDDSIAIISMDCRFPGGCDSPEEYWQLLLEGRDAIVEIPSERWDRDAFYSSERSVAGKMYVTKGGFIEDVDKFDAGFFKLSPKEVKGLDPQQRLLLEVTETTLARAGISQSKLKYSNTGVFIGLATHDYVHLMKEQSSESEINLYFQTGNSSATASGRISFYYGFEGPSVTIDTACSSSLVGVHLACQSLRAGESDMALAGGVNLMLDPDTTISFCKGSMLSEDGRCKTFDADANGYIRSEGCGLVLLKRLDDALRDNDPILAVIKGSAVNQDGASSGLTAPNGPSQERVIRAALLQGNVEPATVSFVETHGTGTSLGDPIEVMALQNVYRSQRSHDQPLYLGAVKTQLGHMEAAAGIASLMKVVLMMQHKQRVKNLHFHKLNPNIILENLALANELSDWDVAEGQNRIAGVSSFGFSGTNTHVIIEELSADRLTSSSEDVAPHPAIFPSDEKNQPYCVLISAKSANALALYIKCYQAYMRKQPELFIGDVAYSSVCTQLNAKYRAVLIGQSLPEIIQSIEEYRFISGHTVSEDEFKTAWYIQDLSETQLTDYYHLLNDTSPIASASRDECLACLKKRDPTSNLSVMRFITAYMLASLWKSLGVKADCLMGEGTGEYVAAVLSGVITLEAGLKLAYHRPGKITAKSLVRFKEAAISIHYEKPTKHLISSFTGKMVKDTEIDADYWLSQLQEMPNLVGGLSTLNAAAMKVCLEIGVDSSSALDMARKKSDEGQESSVIFIPSLTSMTKPWQSIMEAVGQLFVAGCWIDWDVLYPVSHYQKVVLPAYPFEKKRYWFDSKPSESLQLASKQSSVGTITASCLPDAPSDLLFELKSLPFNEANVRLQRHLTNDLSNLLQHSEHGTVDLETGFFELGVDSLLAVEFVLQIKDVLGDQVAITSDILFSYPTIKALSHYLLSELGGIKTERTVAQAIGSFEGDEPIAIIGMDCRFPGGCDSPESYWQLLHEGVNAVGPSPAGRWYEAGAVVDSILQQGGFIEGIDLFDAGFFKISPKEAQYLDPQQRILLEVAETTLERSGIARDTLKHSKTGVFIGLSSHDYGQLLREQLSDFEENLYIPTGNSNATASGRLSYYYGFEGPSMTVDTACSSSLVSIHLACQSLRSGESDMVLAGGIHLMLDPRKTVALYKSEMLSPDHRCATFDASANGYVRSEGCGLVLLKRLSDAIRDNDSILAVIKGSAVNQDGASSGLTVPYGPSQVHVMEAALSQAGVASSAVSYVETHGTGTVLGDPIEVAALQEVYGAARGVDTPVYLGAVKSQLGHLEAAAGIAGLLKVVLMLQHQYLVKNHQFKTLNPNIHLKHDGVVLADTTSEWRVAAAESRIAGLSSFGFSGTNAHVIVEEWLHEQSKDAIETSYPYTLVLSAKSEGCLLKYIERYRDHIATHPELSIGDMAYSSANSHLQASHRAFVVGVDRDAMLTALEHGHYVTGKVTEVRGLVGVFSNHKTRVPWYDEMYARNQAFKEAVAHCFSYVSEAEVFKDPALCSFVTDYGLAHVWQSLGLSFERFWGVGVGLYVARVLSGEISLAEGFRGVSDGVATEDEFEIFASGAKSIYFDVSATFLGQSVIPEDCQVITAQISTNDLEQSLIETLGALYVLGCSIDWTILYPASHYQKVLLPTYPFERARYWFQRQKSAVSLGIALSSGFLRTKLNSPGQDQIYSGVLSLEQYVALSDHIVLGQVIFPATGYLELCFEALHPQSMYGLSEIHFEQTLRLKEGTSVGIQVIMSASQVTIYSEGTDSWQTHCHANVLTDIDWVEKHLNIEAYVARAVKVLHKEALYSECARGVSYGPSFQGLQALYILESGVLAEVSLAKSGEYIADIGVLDSCLQSVSGLLLDDAQTYIPKSIKRVCLKGSLPSQVWVYIDKGQFQVDARGVRVSLELYTVFGEQIGLIDSLRLSVVSSLQLTEDMTSRELYYDVVWEVQRSVNAYGHRDKLSVPRLTQLNLSNCPDDFMHQRSLFEEACRSLLLCYVWEVFTTWEIGQTFSCSEIMKGHGFQEEHQRLVEHLLGLLASSGCLFAAEGLWRVLRQPEDVRSRVQDYLARCKDFEIELQLLCRCGESLGAVLRGEIRGLDLLFPEASTISAERLYHESRSYQALHAQFVDMFTTWLAAYPEDRSLRILEIGAGTGGTTRHILPLLRSCGRVVDYIYTDISPSFFQGASLRFSEDDFVQYHVLDIERSLGEQGIADAQYDVVIAANVLHATRCMADTLSHVQSLLVEGGYLFLLENTHPSYFADLTFGLLEGWWRFEDTVLRENYPLLSISSWQTLLTAEGFEPRVVTDKMASQAIILSQKIKGSQNAIEPAQRWLLIHDAEAFAEALQLCLSKHGVALDAVRCVEEVNQNVSYARIVFAELNEAFEGSLAVETESRSVRLLQGVQGFILNASEGYQALPACDLLISNDLVNSALWGMGRCLQNEYPDWVVRLIDCDATDELRNVAHALWVSSLEQSHENQLQLRDGQLAVCRLQKSKLNIVQSSVKPISTTGVYLITGGLNGIGYAVCEWLVGQGARQIALLSRRQATSAQEQDFLNWAAQGSVVRAYAVDISDSEALEVIYQQIQCEQGGVKHVIHSAGVLSDATILNQTQDSYHRVYQAKVYGAWHLHELTRDDSLEHFIVFSSMCSLLGTPGQSNHAAANSFLDALIHYRRAEGLKGLAINWGAWGEIGSTLEASPPSSQSLQPMATQEGLQAFYQLCFQHSQTTQIGVMLMDWAVYHAGQIKVQPMYSAFMQKTESKDMDHSDLLIKLEGLSLDASGSLLHDYLSNTLVKTLQYADDVCMDAHKSFFELGLDSLTSAIFSQQISRALSIQLNAQKLFDYPTISKLTQYILSILQPLEKKDLPVVPTPAMPKSEEQEPVDDNAIAVIGMSFKLPSGVETLGDLADKLEAGYSFLQDIPQSRIDFDENPEQTKSIYVRSGSFIEDPDLFDAAYFDIAPHEANYLDPQIRLLLEASTIALEEANQIDIEGSLTGVFIGAMNQDYNSLFDDQSVTSNHLSALSGRLAHYHGVEGPVLTVNTACSSSLVSVCLAAKSLRHRECDLAIAGGVNLIFSSKPYEEACKANLLSPDDCCAPFDEHANGFIRGEGVGIIILKRLTDAVIAQDNILAVIKGVAVNHDGSSMTYASSNTRSQERLIRTALKDSGLSPEAVHYIEAHSTAQVVEDAIELEALQATYGQSHDETNPLYVGSIKTNMGHLEGAAGITGFIKTILQLQQGVIYPHLNLESPTSKFDWSKSSIRVPTKTMQWPRNVRRRAAVSSSGFSGTNAHIILESYEEKRQAPFLDKARTCHVLALSAKSPAALEARMSQYILFLSKEEAPALSDICFTNNCFREQQSYRFVAVGSSKIEIIEQLQRHHAFPISSNDSELQSIVRLYLEGKHVEWQILYRNSAQQKVMLPIYPFERRRYWFDQQLDLDTSLEGKLQSIWQHVLGVTDIQLSDDFFKLGGYSTLAIQLVGQINATLGCQIEVKDLYAQQTISGLLPLIRHSAGLFKYKPYYLSSILPFTDEGLFPLTNVQQGYLLGRSNQFELGNTSTHAYKELIFQTLDIDRFEQAWNQLILRHGALRTIFVKTQQRVLNKVDPYIIKRHFFVDAKDLLAIRTRLGHKIYDPNCYPLFDVEVSESNDGVIVHLSMDLLSLDAVSIRTMLTEWERLYHDLSTPLPSLALTFRHYMEAYTRIRESALFAESREYWEKRIAAYDFDMRLPYQCAPSSINQPTFSRITKD